MATGDGSGVAHLREVAPGDSLVAKLKDGWYPVIISSKVAGLLGNVPGLVQQYGGQSYVDYIPLITLLAPSIHVADKVNESIFMTRVSIKTLDGLMRLLLPYLVPTNSLVKFQAQVCALIQTKDGFLTAAQGVGVEIQDVLAPDDLIQELTNNHQHVIEPIVSNRLSYASLAGRNGFLSARGVVLLAGLPQTTVVNAVAEALECYSQWLHVFTQIAPHNITRGGDGSFLSVGERTISLSQSISPPMEWLTPTNLSEPQIRLQLLFASFSAVTGDPHSKRLAENFVAEALVRDENSYPLLVALADKLNGSAIDKLVQLGEAAKVSSSSNNAAKAARIEAALEKLDSRILESLEGPNVLVKLTTAVVDALASDTQFNKNNKLHRLLGTSQATVFGELAVLASALTSRAIEELTQRELGSLAAIKFLMSGGVETDSTVVHLHDTAVCMFAAKILLSSESDLLIPNQGLQNIAHLILRDRDNYVKCLILNQGCRIVVEADEFLCEIPTTFCKNFYAGRLTIADFVGLAQALHRQNTAIPAVASHPRSSVDCVTIVDLVSYLFAALGIHDNASGPSAFGETEIIIRSSTTDNICFGTKKPDLQQVKAAIRRYEVTGKSEEFLKPVIQALNDTVAAIHSAGVMERVPSDPFHSLIGAADVFKQLERQLQLSRGISAVQTSGFGASGLGNPPPSKRRGAQLAPQGKRSYVVRPMEIKENGDNISIGWNHFSKKALQKMLGSKNACIYTAISNKDTHPERVAYCPYGDKCSYSHEISAFPTNWFKNGMAQRCRVSQPTQPRTRDF